MLGIEFQGFGFRLGDDRLIGAFEVLPKRYEPSIDFVRREGAILEYALEDAGPNYTADVRRVFQKAAGGRRGHRENQTRGIEQLGAVLIEVLKVRRGELIQRRDIRLLDWRGGERRKKLC